MFFASLAFLLACTALSACEYQQENPEGRGVLTEYVKTPLDSAKGVEDQHEERLDKMTEAYDDALDGL